MGHDCTTNADSMQLKLIGQVARELGVSTDWLRRAERDGRLPRARRHMSGWRVYSAKDVAVIRALLVPASQSEISRAETNKARTQLVEFLADFLDDGAQTVNFSALATDDETTTLRDLINAAKTPRRVATGTPDTGA